MKQGKFPYQYFSCRMGGCGWVWRRRRPDDPLELAEVTCPRCGTSIADRAKDKDGLPILDRKSRQPLNAIRLWEGHDQIALWAELFFHQEQRFPSSAHTAEIVQIPGWWYDVILPRVSSTGWALLCILKRHQGPDGWSYIGQRRLAFRLGCKVKNLREGKGLSMSRSSIQRTLDDLYRVKIEYNVGDQPCSPVPILMRLERGRSNSYMVLSKLPEGAWFGIIQK